MNAGIKRKADDTTNDDFKKSSKYASLVSMFSFIDWVV